jgi:hypothetical protein
MIPFKKLAQVTKQTALLKFSASLNTPTEGLEQILLHCEKLGYMDKVEIELSKHTNKIRTSGYYKATDVFRLKQSFIELMRS